MCGCAWCNDQPEWDGNRSELPTPEWRHKCRNCGGRHRLRDQLVQPVSGRQLHGGSNQRYLHMQSTDDGQCNDNGKSPSDLVHCGWHGFYLFRIDNDRYIERLADGSELSASQRWHQCRYSRCRYGCGIELGRAEHGWQLYDIGYERHHYLRAAHDGQFESGR